MSTPDESARANVYSLLARLLAAPPDEEVLNLLRSIGADDPDAKGLAAAWHLLRLAAERSDAQSLDDEYHALFIGVGRGELVPFGSWYMTGFLMDQPLALLRQDLEQLGFERQDDVQEPEDHAAALCETMALMINQPVETPVALQKTFFGNHLQPWMGQFFDDLENAESATFYRAVGRLGKELMEFETQYLSMPA